MAKKERNIIESECRIVLAYISEFYNIHISSFLHSNMICMIIVISGCATDNQP